MSGYDFNEINEKSNGGTELSIRAIQNSINSELLKDFQIIPSRVRDIKQDKIRIFNLHDLALDPEASHLKDSSSRDRFHKLVFVSNWQMQDYVRELSIPETDKLQVIENPIVPFSKVEKKFNDKINLVYFSSPHRGLNILVPVFEELAKKYSNVHLHVFSSFKLYGWDNMDEKFQSIYDRISNHPNMTYYGFETNDVLRNFLLNEAHILAYPCTFMETSCRVLIESMSAGLLCVHPNITALPETSGGLTMMYQYIENTSDHSAVFYKNLEIAIKAVQDNFVQGFLKSVKNYADTRYNLNKITNMWETMLSDLKIKYPDIKSRQIVQSSQMFTYNR